MYQEINPEDQEKFFRKGMADDCSKENHAQKQKENEDPLMNHLVIRNSYEEKILSPSYYSGNLFTLSDERKKKLNCDSDNSLGNDYLWLDSINYQ